MATAIGEYELTGWDEDTYFDLADGGKLARVRVTHKFSGDIEGTGEAQRLFCYRDDGSAHFVGLQHVLGTIAGRSGTIVMRTIGEYDGITAKGAWAVIAGSGTGGLKSLRGQGDFEAPAGRRAWFTLLYELD